MLPTIENGSVRLSEQLIYHGFSDLERPSAARLDCITDKRTDWKFWVWNNGHSLEPAV